MPDEQPPEPNNPIIEDATIPTQPGGLPTNGAVRSDVVPHDAPYATDAVDSIDNPDTEDSIT